MNKNNAAYKITPTARSQLAFSSFLGLLLFFSISNSYAAVYKLTFTGTWKASDITEPFPSTAHFTQLIGATHIAGQPFWEPGMFATLGVENVAEIGDSTILQTEINTAIAAGTAANMVFTPEDIASFPGMTKTVFEVLDTHTNITLISMIAPSPDWYIGTYNLPLKNGNSWISDFTINLTPWDAGTEEGNQFKLRNPPTTPKDTIATPIGSPFISLPSIGTLHFEHISPNADINENGNVDAGDLVLAMRFFLGIVTPTIQQLARADIMPLDIQGNPEPDGSVTAADVLRISQFLLNF